MLKTFQGGCACKAVVLMLLVHCWLSSRPVYVFYGWFLFGDVVLSFLKACLAQFEKRIKPRVYVRRITRSTMYKKAPIC